MQAVATALAICLVSGAVCAQTRTQVQEQSSDVKRIERSVLESLPSMPQFFVGPGGAFPDSQAISSLYLATGALFKDGVNDCSGTLIEPRAFLTAGHCVIDKDYNYLDENAKYSVFFLLLECMKLNL